MTDRALRAALERRYDGPVPAGAAVAADGHLPWRQQITARKDLAWQEVRRIARRPQPHEADGGAERRGRRVRFRLACAVATWALYRDWLRALDGRDRTARGRVSGERSGR